MCLYCLHNVYLVFVGKPNLHNQPTSTFFCRNTRQVSSGGPARHSQLGDLKTLAYMSTDSVNIDTVLWECAPLCPVVIFTCEPEALESIYWLQTMREFDGPVLGTHPCTREQMTTNAHCLVKAPELAVIAVTRHTEYYLSRALLNPIIYRRLNAL